MNDDRLVDIETKVAYQEDTIQALNDALCNQQKQIELLEAHLKILAEKMGELAQSGPGEKQAHEIPPHY